MGEVGLPHRMFRLGAEPEGRKRINNYFTLRWIEIIKGALDDEHLKKLLDSQFGNVMHMGTHQFSLMFLHYILSRQLVTEKKYEMWWLFAGKPIRFAVDDFALATGLNCSKTGFKKEDEKGRSKRRGGQRPSRFFKSLFGNESKPTTKWIVGKLTLGKKYKDAITRFRLALLLLVDGILCPTCANTIISPEHVEMVKNIDVFLSYLWGRNSFLTTVRSAKQRTWKELKQKTTAIQGFPHALVLVTVICCPAIIYTQDDAFNILDITHPIEAVVQNVVHRSLNINVQDARTIDQSGMDHVTSLLNEEGIGLSFSDEEDDEEVSHMVNLILDEHPFEHNSWVGGVDASEAVESSNDEPTEEAIMDDVEIDGAEEQKEELHGNAEQQEELHGNAERDKDNCVTEAAGYGIKKRSYYLS